MLPRRGRKTVRKQKQTADAAADADRAMAWLAKAVAAGYADCAHMEDDTDLEALRGRADFQKLVAPLPRIPAGGRQVIAPAGDFFPRVYAELRWLAAARLAGEPAGHTLNATALVHEAYLRLGDTAFADRSGFFRAAAVVMRRILVDHARSKRPGKRGGGVRSLEVADDGPVVLPDPDLLLDVDAALARLAAEDPGSDEVARLRLFAELSVEDAAGALGVSRATAYREWAYARAWLAAAHALAG